MYTGDEGPMVAYCPNCGTKRIKMYYEDSDPNAIMAGTKDVTLKDIVKYKYKSIGESFYKLRKKIRSFFSNNEKR